MAWIKTINESDADEELKKIYETLAKKRGKVANILKIQSLLPKTMLDHLNLYLHIMFNQSTISREDKELIAVVVSKLNNCSYCLNHHAEALNSYWKNNEKIKRFLENLDYSMLSTRQQAVMCYAKKLTTHPDSMEQADIENLKNSKFTDKEILEIVLIVSYFNFVNRMALGLHVTFTEEEMKGYKY